MRKKNHLSGFFSFRIKLSVMGEAMWLLEAKKKKKRRRQCRMDSTWLGFAVKQPWPRELLAVANCDKLRQKKTRNAVEVSNRECSREIKAFILRGRVVIELKRYPLLCTTVHACVLPCRCVRVCFESLSVWVWTQRKGGEVGGGGRQEEGRKESGWGKLLYLVSHLLWCTAQASLPGG